MKQFNFSVTMASKILKMGSRVIFWVGEPPQNFFSKSEGVGEIMLFYFNFDQLSVSRTLVHITTKDQYLKKINIDVDDLCDLVQ